MSQTTATDERAMLLAYLDVQRNHVLGILEGLSDEDLRRPMLPTGWTCVGMVQHLALDVERFWFRTIVAGEAADLLETSWQVPADVPSQSVFDRYREEIERANAIIRSTPLDAPPKAWPVDIWPDWRHENLRQTMLHVITETACHAGHLDAARELIDGRTWMVLD
jgi:uncharacterized damage-inducible protein DinB